MDRERGPESRLPLPASALEILLALVHGEALGYAMMQAVEQRGESGA